MAWWRHNSVTIHVTKVYFIQLVLKIKYVEFEDNPKNFIQKKPKNVKVFLLEDWWKNFLPKKMENMNIGQLSAKVTNNRFDRTHCGDWHS